MAAGACGLEQSVREPCQGCDQSLGSACQEEYVSYLQIQIL